MRKAGGKKELMDEEWLDVVPESSAEVGLDTTTVQALKDLLTAERCLNMVFHR